MNLDLSAFGDCVEAVRALDPQVIFHPAASPTDEVYGDLRGDAWEARSILDTVLAYDQEIIYSMGRLERQLVRP